MTRRKPRVLESRIERVKTAQRARGSVWHAKKHTIHTGESSRWLVIYSPVLIVTCEVLC